MEKRKPTYDLAAIKAAIGAAETLSITSSALRDAVGLGEVTMVTKVGTLPKTMPSPETGETLTRGVRPFKATYKGKTITVDLPGYYPKGAGDGLHVGNDMSVVDRALRMLKEKVDGIPAPETIRKVRTKLRLSQRRAGALFRVGPNAFDKYERGLIEPSGPTVQLITILNRHPELVKELEGA